MKLKNRHYILSALLPIQWLMVTVLSSKTEWIEIHYSQGIYPSVSKFLQNLFGRFSFSFGDLVYAILIIYTLTFLYRLIKYRKISFKTFFFRTVSAVSVIYFLFYFNWGLNYFRQPLDLLIGLEKTTYTDEELISVTQQLLQESNSLHLNLVEHDTLLIDVSTTYSKTAIRKMAVGGYKNLQIDLPNSNLANSIVKPSLFSEPLSYMGFAGYLNPWTNEAQVNDRIPLNAYAATASHEIAHQLGYASESEANFIGYLAGKNNSDPLIQYSSTVMALRYCLFEVYKRDSEKYEEFLEQIHLGIKKDFRQRREFWERYQNWTEPFFKLFYDSYLKANNQAHGIQSYNRMVGLVVNYRLQQALN